MLSALVGLGCGNEILSLGPSHVDSAGLAWRFALSHWLISIHYHGKESLFCVLTKLICYCYRQIAATTVRCCIRRDFVSCRSWVVCVLANIYISQTLFVRLLNESYVLSTCISCSRKSDCRACYPRLDLVIAKH